ncbi:MAG TPA: hypothetical protein VEK34_03915 [Methylocella sp.]|nr:hypothetical protein [Methylocella sp.]
MQPRPSAVLWMASAFASALAVTAVVLLAYGTGLRGTAASLAATGRLSFLLFWAAYTGGALRTLFGGVFQPLKERGREFGLAFASAHLVHLGLVGWLCWIGYAPGANLFIFFGIPAVFVYLLALFSIDRFQRALGPTSWWILRTVGMHWIAYVFYFDFAKFPPHAGMRHIIEYLPFAILAVAGPSLRLAAWGSRLRHRLRDKKISKLAGPKRADLPTGIGHPCPNGKGR